MADVLAMVAGAVIGYTVSRIYSCPQFVVQTTATSFTTSATSTFSLTLAAFPLPVSAQVVGTSCQFPTAGGYVCGKVTSVTTTTVNFASTLAASTTYTLSTPNVVVLTSTCPTC